MTPKLEIHPADGDFVAATYTLDKTASVTGRGLSAFDAVANLRVYLQPFGYELPNVEISQVRVGTVSPTTAVGMEYAGTTTAAKSVEYCQPGTLVSDGMVSDEMSDQPCMAHETPSLAGPISECESAVDRVFGGVYGNNVSKN